MVDSSGRIEMLYFDGCPSAEAFLPRLRELLARAGAQDRLELRRVETIEDAEGERFLASGSTVPTSSRAPGSAPTTD